EFAAGVYEDDLPFTVPRLTLSKEDDDAGRWCVIEKVVGKQDHPLDKILFNEPATDIAFAVLVLRPTPAGDSACVEYDCGAAVILQCRDRVLQPAPVCPPTGDAAMFEKAAERVSFVYFGVDRLIPHGISDDNVELLQMAFWVAEFRVAYRV